MEKLLASILLFFTGALAQPHASVVSIPKIIMPTQAPTIMPTSAPQVQYKVIEIIIPTNAPLPIPTRTAQQQQEDQQYQQDVQQELQPPSPVTYQVPTGGYSIGGL